MYYISVLVCLWKWKCYMVSLNCYFMLSQQEICFITYQVGMMSYMFLRSHEFLTERTGTSCLYRCPEKFPFPVHFQRSVTMIIGRLFRGQAHYCALCFTVTGGHLGWASNKLRGRGTVWEEAGKIFLASLPWVRQNFDARLLCTYMKPRWPHVPRR